MKPRNREVNIFNMSVLDLLTGALGAFCFLTLALFPSYFKAQNSSAADEQRAAEQQQRTEQQFGKTKKGIPPFSLVDIWAGNDQGLCGVVRIDDVQSPRGNKSFRRLPFASSDAEGYQAFVYLFLFDPGSYRLTLTTYGQISPCKLVFRQFTPQGDLDQEWSDLTNSPAAISTNFEVKPEQLITSILPHR